MDNASQASGIRHLEGRSRLAALGVLLLTLSAAPEPARSQIVEPSDALFADDEPLRVTITMDFGVVLRDRAEEQDYKPGMFSYATDAGEDVTLDLKIKARGYFRLIYLDCDIPPLRLNFKKKQVRGTVFEGQDKLKLVTHCRNRSGSFQQYVLQEYLLYRAYNLLTDVSFRTRLLEITYVDSRGRDASVTKYGFIIEDEDRMAERNGTQLVESGAAIHPEATHRETTTLLSVFQYMIGNTDWGISTRHNIRLIFAQSTSVLFAVPYDFDWSGLISAPYAVPDANLNLRSVRERKYMGFCREEDEFAAVFDRFHDRQDDLMRLFSGFPLLEEKYARRSVAYLEEFFDSIRRPARVRRDFVRGCLG